jgi:hypothetical protein
MSDADRRVLEEFRQRDIGRLDFEARFTFFGAVAGFAAGFVWLIAFHLGDRGVALWPIVALGACGAALGFPIDLTRARHRQASRRANAGARWDPVLAVGVVERLIATASAGRRVDDDRSDTAWFLQVAEDQIVCLWDWIDQPTEHVEVELVPGESPVVLGSTWTGNQLATTPRRRFRPGEHRPEQGELLRGRLDQLDELLARGQSVARMPPPPEEGQGLASLAERLEPLGFFKFVPADQIARARADLGATDRFLRCGRGFDADAERLAEGGVKDLIEEMRAALEHEGRAVGEIRQVYDPAGAGYFLEVAGQRHQMWSTAEAKRSWELTPIRAARLINAWLAETGSSERVHLLFGGHDGVFVLLTPHMRELLAATLKSAMEVPSAVPDGGAD